MSRQGLIGGVLVLCGACSFDGSVQVTSAVEPGLADANDEVRAGDASANDPDGPSPLVDVCPDDSALVLCHEFEASLSDSSSFNNDATGTGHAFAAGVAGQSLSLNAATEVKVADAPSLRFGPDTMTLEAWVFPETISTTNRAGVVDQDGGPSIFIYANGDVQCFAGNRRVGTGPGNIGAGSWVHLACTHQSGTTKIYIDGQLVLEDGGGGSITAGTIGMAVGGNSPSGDPFEGRIDNLRVWTVARTGGEICAAANQTGC